MSNVIDRLDSPPLPFGYQPKWIDFYSSEDEFAFRFDKACSHSGRLECEQR